MRVGADAALTVERDLDLSGAVPEGDGITSALPDWDGRLWFASRLGVLGTVDRVTGRVWPVRLEPNGNSFAGENNFGYLGPASVAGGRSTRPASRAWTSTATAQACIRPGCSTPTPSRTAWPTTRGT